MMQLDVTRVKNRIFNGWKYLWSNIRKKIFKTKFLSEEVKKNAYPHEK